MNLAIISEVAGYPWAGSEELWLATAQRALARGWGVTACLHLDLHRAPSLDRFRTAGGKVAEWKRPFIARFTKIQQRISPNFKSAKLGNPSVLLLSAGSLPSLVNLPGLTEYLADAGIPYLVLCQFNADCLPISTSERNKIKNLLLGAAKVVFVSQQNWQLAERQCSIRLPDAEVVMNPTRTILDHPLPQQESGRIEFGCVARMETLWKGQDVLLEILSKEPWKSRDWHLHFFGDGPDRPHLEAWTIQCGLESRVTFEGYVRSVVEIWANCDAMVLPSRGEGTPLAVLEAMMCGRPVIATDVGGNAEVVEDGATGFIADAATPRSFGAVLERAWNARNQWPEMGREAHVRARKLADADPAEILFQRVMDLISVPA